MRVSRVLAAGEARVVIPTTAHLSLLGPGKCMTPKARSLDGVARALLREGLKPCMLHVALLSRASRANCRVCKRVLMSLMKVVVGIKAPKHLST